jgi:hypothetical protein
MPVVWQISAIHLEDKTLLSGVILDRSPFTFEKKTSQLKNLFKVTKSYFIPVVSGIKILIIANGRILKT